MTVPKKHADLAGKIFVGCSGWAYPSWKPEFYPANVPAKKLLAYYATRLNSVEVNYTFRSLPTNSMIEAWLAQTGEEFRFSFKAPQRITHILRLKNCRDALEQFARALVPVTEAKRVGIILFQLPPNMKADVERLGAFLEDARGLGLRLAFEFRHESWFTDEVYAALRGHAAALCLAESDDLSTPEEYTAGFSCFRLRKSEYSADDLTSFISKLKGRAASGDVFAYFKHEEAPTGAIRASQVLEGLRES